VKKLSKIKSKSRELKIKPEQAIEFLETMRTLQENKDEKTSLISIRIPQNLLRALKQKSEIENKKYQSIIVNYIRIGLKKNL